MASTIFFSWQTDTPADLNKEFIFQALEEAANGMLIDPAERLDVDEGMKETPGSPEVANVLFQKIEAAFLFVGDVTLVGQIPKGGKLLQKDRVVKVADTQKRVPNPNVAVELGYADGVLRWQRVIRVMNTAYGKPEQQPFDVRNRRFPITYCLAEDATDATKTGVKTKLVTVLKDAIAAAQTFQLKRAEQTRDRLDVHAVEMMIEYGKKPWEFPQPAFPDQSSPLPFLRDLGLFHHCTVRLLELGIIQTNLGNNNGVIGYTYHWTPFGKKVHELIPKPGVGA
jgi:hypothetical protein